MPHCHPRSRRLDGILLLPIVLYSRASVAFAVKGGEHMPHDGITQARLHVSTGEVLPFFAMEAQH
jgi:hypothetical protein